MNKLINCSLVSHGIRISARVIQARIVEKYYQGLVLHYGALGTHAQKEWAGFFDVGAIQ
jgi:hypothetical protein